MQSDVFPIEWGKPVAGFRVAEVKNLGVATWAGLPEPPRGGWALVVNDGPGVPGGYERYSPLEDEPALFRNFAELSPDDPDAIRTFADRYGSLEGTAILGCRPPGGEKGVLYLRAEHGDVWGRAARTFRYAVEVWGYIPARQLGELKHLIRVRPTDIGGGQMAPRWWFSNYHDNPLSKGRDSVVADIGPADGPDAIRDVLAAAEAWLWNLVNSAHERWTYTRYVMDPGTSARRRMTVCRTLLALMWCQFGEAVAASKGYSRCKECDKWSETGAGLRADRRRAARLFCSAACKNRSFRRRRERAIGLRAEGKTLAQIAKLLKADGLETDETTLKKWVGTKRGR